MNLNELPLEDSPFLLDEHGPIFILGCPRSGTTFLSHVIGLLEDVEEFVGVLVPPRMMHRIGRDMSEGRDVRELTTCARDVFWQAFWRRRLFFNERLSRAYTNRQPLRLLRRGTMAGSVFSYKEPFLCFAAKAFAEEFPRARFVHIIRDGRDNADSLERTYPHALSDEVLRDVDLAQNKCSEIGAFRVHEGVCVPWWVEIESERRFIDASRYGRCIWMWREMTSRARALGNVVDSTRYFEIRYDRMVSDPIHEAEGLLGFLGGTLTHDAKRKLRSSFTRSVGIAAQRQPPERLNEAVKIAGDLLEELGYTAPGAAK